MQALQKRVKTQDQMLSELEGEHKFVMEYLEAKEDNYATMKDKLNVSKQQLSYIEKEKEKTFPDLHHFSSNHQMKTRDILTTFFTSTLIRLVEKPST